MGITVVNIKKSIHLNSQNQQLSYDYWKILNFSKTFLKINITGENLLILGIPAIRFIPAIELSVMICQHFPMFKLKTLLFSLNYSRIQ